MKKNILKAIPELLARVTIGWVFIESGWGKLHNLASVTEFFQSLNIPFASIQAPFVAGVELVAGAMILTGIFTRLASIPLIFTMIVAIATAKRDDITDFSSLLGSIEFLYIVVLVWLAAYGSNYLAVDKVLFKATKKGPCKTACAH